MAEELVGKGRLELGLRGLRSNTWRFVYGSFPKKGDQSRILNSRILIIRTPKYLEVDGSLVYCVPLRVP